MFERGRQRKEIEREVRFKQGLSRVRGYVDKTRQAQKRYWELGKRALKLGDRQQFGNLAKAFIRTGDLVTRWERYLVAMETVSVQLDQLKATGECAKAMKALSESMMAFARPEDMTKMQMDLERAMTRAQTLDETLSAVMDAANDSIFSSEGISDDSLSQIENAMKGEAAQEESAPVMDDRISQGLKRIEEEMKKEIK